MELPKRFDHKEIEKRVSEFWMKSGIFSFKRDSNKPVFVIDTPPPFTSGVPHMGHALWWTWNDLIARYKRMRGFNVLLPQGWDCHGLPTELKVEKHYGISKDDKENFLKACREWTEKCIERMKSKMIEMGYSADWSQEYSTDTEEYMGFVQKTLINLYEKGLLVRVKHPVMWCPRCKTSLAKAEVGYVEKEGTLYYIRFPLKDSEKHITIATTRPELLPACVAIFVHPQDERYTTFVGKKAIVPFFNREVEIIPNPDVDPEFGTGAVYLCTYGDESDIKWQKRYGLPEINVVNENGTLNENAGKFSGLSVEDARIKIIEELGAEGLVEREEKITHRVLSHTERQNCLSPIEFIPKMQWVIKVRELNDKILELAEKIRWSPEHMKTRLVNWIKSMDWDWIISRQRVYGTPIPFFVCTECDFSIPGKPFIDPSREKPPVEKCPKCGGTVKGEEDVCDGWVDSSITPLVVSGYWRGDTIFDNCYPTSLRQQGHDIIRTWAYYTLVRCYLETGEIPWKEVLINGMVLGPDGREMHKSLGNVVEPDEVLEKHGADVVRAGLVLLGAYGKDSRFSWKDMEFASRFATKFWNISRFCGMHMKDEKAELSVTDRWMLSKLQRLVSEVTGEIENYQFNVAFTKLHDFIWNEFADNYIEFVKYRLYSENPGGAPYVLYVSLYTFVRLLAPFMPFLAEEIYQKLFRKRISVHIEDWPEPVEELVDTEAEKTGEILKAIIAGIRQFKSKNSIPLNARISKVEVFIPDLSLGERIKDDIRGIMKVEEVKFRKGDFKLRISA
ncbi:MAG: valine--tRNA ligase [Candidatus Micrarchaeota archaeon]|nr:valine--tRNA ligase [Candidatus Micrarchaeota archaeon]